MLQQLRLLPLPLHILLPQKSRPLMTALQSLPILGMERQCRMLPMSLPRLPLLRPCLPQAMDPQRPSQR